jgi:23S rRNA-/tRNA-specific pseudouridylate synthase
MLPALQFDSPYIPFLVHRLDKQTTGCLIIARNRKIAEILADVLSLINF